MTEEYDMIVIGAGSGGMSAAKKAAGHGASVALIEKRTIGGTCVARGCMPKKFLYYAASKISEIKTNGPNGFRTEAHDLDWAELINHQQRIVDELISSNRDGVEEYDNIDIIEGTASLLDRKTVTVNDREVTASTIILAMGLRPLRPPIDGAEYGITSDQFLKDHTLPQSMIIVGGGFIAVEFASILNAFGVNVKIFQRPPCLINNHDTDVAEVLQDQLETSGIEIHTNAEVTEITKQDRAYRVSVNEDSTQRHYSGKRVLLATGRRPNTEDMNLESNGVPLENGYVEVNEYLQSTVDTIYAVGDITGESPFTPVAILEGKKAALNALEENEYTIDHEFIPSAVFSKPQIGSVGVTEEEARTEYDSIEVATKQFRPFESAVEKTSGTVFIKLIYRNDTNTLVGLHLVGENASEIVQGFAPAMKNKITMSDLKDFPGIHPTIAEEIFSTKPD